MRYVKMNNSSYKDKNKDECIYQILKDRGFKSKNDIEHFLNLSDKDILDPLRIDRLQLGVKMLMKHISKNDKIFIQVDSDCDGYTSSAILINYLFHIVPNFVINNISYRIHEGKQHGLIVNTIPEDVKLVIAPDSSSNNFQEHEELMKKGIEVLVIDHHEAEKISEYACIVNNQLCDYPTKSLSGAGMVYKFCSYIDKILGVNYSSSLLDLTALGLIGDMMDLRFFETKRIIDKGLSNITNPFLYRMVDGNFFLKRESLTSIGIAFSVVPYINAIVRVGTYEQKKLLFESMLDFKAYEKIPSNKRGHKEGDMEFIIDQALRVCANVKRKQDSERDKMAERIEEIIEQKELNKNKILIIPLEEDVNRNLVGLIANQIMAKYHKSTLVLSHCYEGESDYWEGSGRGFPNEIVPDFKSFLNDSQKIIFAEGHGNAFGVRIKSLKECQEIIEYANKIFKNLETGSYYLVDDIFQGGSFNSELVIEINKFKKLWGNGIPEPCFAVENIPISKGNLQLMSPDKKPTLKLILSNGVELIKFKSSEQEYLDLLPRDGGCKKISVVGNCSVNEWNDKITPQIIVKDYEITSDLKYYF